MTKSTTNIINWFVSSNTKSKGDWYELSKLELTLKISFITIFLNLLLLPTIYKHDKQSFFFNLIAFAAAFSIPVLIKTDKFQLVKGALLIAFLGLANMHFTANDPSPLGIGSWYIVFILVATFLFGSRWGLIYLLISLAVCLSIIVMESHGISLYNWVIPEKVEFPLFPFIRILFPFTVIFMVAKEYQYHRTRSEAELTAAIEDQKCLTKEIESNKEKIVQLLDTADDFIYEIDGNGKFTYINPMCHKLTGYSNDEILKLGFNDLVLPEFKKEHKAFYFKQVKEQLTQTYFEFPIRCKDGRIVWLGQKVSMKFQNGKLYKSLCITRDISTQKQIMEELRKAKVDADKAKEVAEKASLAKADFLSAMSHELRTPMNAVVGLTHYLLKTEPREDQVENLHTLKFSSENLLSLINDILDFSKIEAGKIEIENISFNLREFTKSVKASLSTKSDNKGIAFNLNYDPKLPDWVKGDPTRLAQILNNLVGNSLKFTEAGGKVDLNVKLLEKEDQRYIIHFEVADTGIGIPEGKIDSIFENFTQAASFTTRKYGGTGLGLSITKKLLEAQNSQIKVKSKLGEGSTFYFTLCLDESEKEGLRPNDTKIDSSGEKDLKGVKVLLVEDNKINQVVAKKFLGMWEMEIEVAENGLEAVEFVQRKKFDLVLMDLQMPEMDGFEATKMIRSLGSSYKDLPILALTASAVMEIKSKAFDVGMNDYIMKPFNPDQLYRKIKDYSRPKEMTA